MPPTRLKILTPFISKGKANAIDEIIATGNHIEVYNPFKSFKPVVEELLVAYLAGQFESLEIEHNFFFCPIFMTQHKVRVLIFTNKDPLYKDSINLCAYFLNYFSVRYCWTLGKAEPFYIAEAEKKEKHAIEGKKDAPSIKKQTHFIYTYATTCVDN